MYENGLGVVRNDVQAYLWFSVAAQQGYVRALDKKDEVSAKLSEEQRKQAQSLAKKCIDSEYNDCEL